VVPLADSVAQVLPRESPLAVRSHRRERLHVRSADRKYVAIGGEPVGLLAGLFLVLLGITVVEDLHLDAVRQLPRLKRRERGFGHPAEDSRVAAAFQVPPLGHEFKVRDRFLRANYADGLACAVRFAAVPLPGVRCAVDVLKVRFAQLAPAGTSTVDRGLGQLGLVGRCELYERGKRENAKRQAKGVQHGGILPGG
jgi:hypothetical protein